ncbi:MAG TPA: type II toxin-antitoxin system prevent-host-death family antitoxin [Thermoanaerobaculia bacterium]|nr:type II toxin-antitoxin system prevent-host-death family antitoxin [Thermoanaerobaculia bacterium]
MREMTIREMRAELGRLEEVLDVEGEVVVTRHGKPIARVLPLGASRKRPRHDELRASMPRLERGSEEIVRADRDGR